MSHFSKQLVSAFCVSLTIALPALAATGFSDVPQSNPEYEAIAYVQSHGIMTGSEDGNFHPELSLTRCELAKVTYIASRVLPLTGSGDPADFSDLSVDNWCNTFVHALKRLNVLNGYPDGTFRPNQKVSQIEALKIIFNSTHVHLPTVTTQLYNDVHANDWWAPYIAYAQNYGIMHPRSGTSYGIQSPMSRGETAYLLWKLLGTGPHPIDNIMGSFYGEEVASFSIQLSDKNVKVMHFCDGKIEILPSIEEAISLRVCIGKNTLVVRDPVHGDNVIDTRDSTQNYDLPALLEAQYAGNAQNPALHIAYPLQYCHIATNTCGTSGSTIDHLNFIFDLNSHQYQPL